MSIVTTFDFYPRTFFFHCFYRGRKEERGGRERHIDVREKHWLAAFSQFDSLVLNILLRPRTVQPFGVSGPHSKKSHLGPHIKYTNTNEDWWAKEKGGDSRKFVLGHIHSHHGLQAACGLRVGHPWALYDPKEQIQPITLSSCIISMHSTWCIGIFTNGTFASHFFS